MSAEDASPKPSFVERMREQRERHLSRPFYVRVLWVIGGFTLLLAGLAMLVLPGPALVVIPVALAILSLEFAWAGRALEFALEKAEQAQRSAKQTSRVQRILVAGAGALAAIAFVVAALLWDIPVVPYL
jgi:uncharacterized protein (TIGR02611 family)